MGARATLVPTKIPKSQKQIVAISVKLEVITPDKLRKIIFGLTKGTDDGMTTWTINFELHDREKKADEFGKVIDLDVEVKSKNHPLAEETATKGLNRPQVEHAVLRAAPAAKKLAAGKTSQPAAERTIEGVLSARANE
jgi:hypothetical protein